jgi:hypothetical protein
MDFHEVDWQQFYIRKPLRRAWGKIKRRAARVWDKVSGRWWCEGCDTYHSARIICYSLDGESGYCFRSIKKLALEVASETPDTPRDAMCRMIAGCEHIGSGRETVTYEIKKAFREGYGNDAQTV